MGKKGAQEGRVEAGGDPGSPHNLTSSQIPKAEPRMNSGSNINGTILETQETFTLTHTVLGKTPGCHTRTGWDGNTGKNM